MAVAKNVTTILGWLVVGEKFASEIAKNVRE
jgi:hypothetical protein